MRVYFRTSIGPVVAERHCRISRAALHVGSCATNVCLGSADFRENASRPCTTDRMLRRGNWCVPDQKRGIVVDWIPFTLRRSCTTSAGSVVIRQDLTER